MNDNHTQVSEKLPFEAPTMEKLDVAMTEAGDTPGPSLPDFTSVYSS